MTFGPRVAIACSGLGHIQRGIESWAFDTARGLIHAGIDATLFGGAPGPGITAIPCLRRADPAAKRIAGALKHLGGWRFGAGSPYEVEQTSFSIALWRRIGRSFDLLHAQDPGIALWFERAHRMGISRPRVIYANGTGEDQAFMARFRDVQVLTETADQPWSRPRPDGRPLFRIPNFIDTAQFAPGDQGAARDRFGLPRDRLIVLCCAAIRAPHKRIDALLRAFAQYLRETGEDAMLVVAGGREPETDALIAEGTRLLGDRVRFLVSVPRADMPDLYRTADLFTLASLFETFGIVFLEAMASGLPVLCHDTPSFRNIVASAGQYRDISTDEGFARGLASMTDPAIRAAMAAAGRAEVMRRFSEPVVVAAMIAMYRAVLDEA